MELGLRLGTREGLGLVLPLRFFDGLELGLRLDTREGLGLSLPLGFSDGLELRLRSQFGAAVWRDVGIIVQTSDKCYIRFKNICEKRHLLFSIPIQNYSIVVPQAENTDDLELRLVAD